MQFALIQEAVEGGVLELTLPDAHVYLDVANDDTYVIFTSDVTNDTVRQVSLFLDELNLEPIPWHECPPEFLPGGRVQHWLIEKEAE